jgi:two-component system LytT family response regulator
MNAPMLRAYLVDDEPLALKRLSQLLKRDGRVEVVGKTTDPETALAFLRTAPVDLLLLDIQMPGVNGFELLAQLPSQPLVIFTTAYDQYALEAFKVNSIDYLLKPVEPKELERALNKVERLRATASGGQLQTQLRNALEQLAQSLQHKPAEFPERIASRLAGRIQFIELSKISHFRANEKLTYAVTPMKQYVVDQTISELEQKLDPKQFVRIHRATLLNLGWVEEVHSWFGGRLVVRLKGEKDAKLTVARDRAHALKQSLGL